MCLAGGIQNNRSNNPMMRTWRSFSACPFRLFTLAALIHSVVVFGMVYFIDMPGSPVNENAILFIALYGSLSTPVLGALLFWLPLRMRRSSISYAWYSFSYFLVFSGLALIEIGMLTVPLWISLGAVLLASAWYMLIHVFKDYPQWTDGRVRLSMQLILAGLYTLLLGIVTFAVGGLSANHALTGFAPLLAYAVGGGVLCLGLILAQDKGFRAANCTPTHCQAPRSEQT